MTLMSRSALIEALAAGRPDGLTGVAETSWLDFKAAPYKLDTDKAKFELCKDVAAFANAQGGLLVLGVKAKKQPDRAQEIAAALHPFPQEEVDVGRYYDTINEYLRPRVSVTHHWYRDPARSTAAELHYLVIEIEPVAERDRWVIVRRTLNDREKFADGLAVPQRHGDRTVFLPAEDVYQLINEGVRARDRVPAAPIPPLGGLADEAEESLNTLQKLQDWDNIPVLFWQSIPPERVGVLPGLHERDGIQAASHGRTSFANLGSISRTRSGGCACTRAASC